MMALDGRCSVLWFHTVCVNMEFSKYSNVNNNKLSCNCTDCIHMSNQFINTLIAHLLDLSSKMSTLISTIDSIKDVPMDVADIKIALRVEKVCHQN